MVKGLIGKKIGMTRLFDEDGNHVPVTVLRAGPCVVLQVKTEENDGYRAAQVGLVDEKAKLSRHTKAMQGHLAAAGGPSVRVIREFEIDGDDEVKPGDQVTVGQFADIGKIDITAISKGRGFQGVIRRHGFGGGKATHGSMFHRAPGSIGSSAYPSRVFKGQRLPGRMGGKPVTQIGVRVLEVNTDENLILVAGSVPGATKGYVFIRPTVRG